MDGFSRCIIYLKCCSNNRAETVLQLFQEGVRNFGLPSRVRADAGVENTQVARFMDEQRGTGRGSFLVGRSVHNTRIERLWAELNRVFTYHYKDLFLFMEHNALLDVSSDADLGALHFVYLPRINRAVTEFCQFWNHHGLSTENNRTPLQLWTSGVLQHFGCSWYNPMNDTSQESIPDCHGSNQAGETITLTTEQETFLQSRVNPLLDDGNNGISHYMQAREYLNQLA